MRGEFVLGRISQDLDEPLFRRERAGREPDLAEFRDLQLHLAPDHASLAPDPNAGLRVRLRELAEERRRFGSPRLHILLRREGWPVNHKRGERICREEGLSLRLKRRRKRTSHLRVVASGPTGPNQQWAMDFMSDSLENGRRFRVLTIADLRDRRSPGLEAAHRPCKPMDNGHVESVNGRLREERLDAQVFSTLDEARKVIEAWRQDYNTARPHSSLGGLSPEEYRRAWSRENQAGQSPNFRLAYSAG
ncbi:MAG: integrase core domain-containing protein [Thermodesulfobacteriota bacterium]